MGNLLDFTNFFSLDQISLVIKVFQISILILFGIYSFLSIRQISLMNQALVSPIHFELRVAVYLQFFLGIGVLILILIR